MSTENIPLNTAASCYGISELELQPLEGGHFAHVYGFEWNHRDYVLRLTPPNADTNLERQRAILAWMAYLAAHGAFVPEPLPSQSGNLVDDDAAKWVMKFMASRKERLENDIPYIDLNFEEMFV